MIRPLLVALCLAAPVAAGPRTDPHGDPLPDGALIRLGTLRDRIGSFRTIRSHALSPDGKTLAIDENDGIVVWDVETGRMARRLPWRTSQGDSPKFGLAFSPDGKYLARLAGRVVALWDLATADEVFDIDLKERGKGQGIAFVPGARQVIVTSDEHSRAFVFEVPSGRLVRTVEFPGKYTHLAPAGKSIVGYRDEVWYLYDTDTGREQARFPGASDVAEWFELAPDGRRAYLADGDGRLRSFDAATGELLDAFELPKGLKNLPRRLALSPDGAVVYLGWGHRRDVKGRQWLPRIPNVPGGISIPTPDGKCLLVLCEDGVLRRYDLITLRELPGVDGFEDSVFAFPSPDGRRVVIESGAFGRSSRLDLFDVTGRCLWSLRPRPDDWGMPRWTPDSRALACVGFHRISLRDAASARVTRTLLPPIDHIPFTSESHIPLGGGKLIAPWDHGQRLVTFDLKGDTATTSIEIGHPGFTDLSPDGRTVLHARPKGELRRIDLATGRSTVIWPQPEGSNRWAAGVAARFSPDASYVLTWETEQARAPTWAPKTMAVLRDPVTLAPKREFEAEEADVFAFSPDGLWLAIGKNSGRWVLYDIPSGERVGVWDGHRDCISSIAFVGLGRVLTGSGDLTALLWDLRSKDPTKQPLWDALAGDDGCEAYRAVWALAADPKAADLLRARVKLVSAPPADKLKAWIADLSADRFAVREAATKALHNLGRLAEPDLRTARDAATAEEVRARIDGLLAKLPRERVGIEVTQARAVAAMELADTDAAKKLLADWAAGAAGARLTVDAKSALARMALP